MMLMLASQELKKRVFEEKRKHYCEVARFCINRMIVSKDEERRYTWFYRCSLALDKIK